jgi:hypothetical protein
MKQHDKPFVITGHDVLGEILRRNKGLIDHQIRGSARRIHQARLGPHEVVESNLPLNNSALRDPKSEIPPRRPAFLR